MNNQVPSTRAELQRYVHGQLPALAANRLCGPGVYQHLGAALLCPDDEFFTVHDGKDMRGPFHFAETAEVREGLSLFFAVVGHGESSS
jgi:hypothetical protein